MVMIGSDPDQLDRVAQTFRTHGQRTQAMANELDAQMRTTWWVGARSDAFRRDWFGSVRPNITRLAEDLLENATKLAQQANQQRQASEANGGGHLGRPKLPYPLVGIPPVVDGWRGVDFSKVQKLLERFADNVLILENFLSGLDDIETLLEVSSAIGLSEALAASAGVDAGLRGTLNEAFRLSGNNVSVRAGLFGTALEGALLAKSWQENGLYSNEFVQDSVEGSIKAAASFVPLGGVAYEVGNGIGTALYEHTPVGEYLLDRHESTSYVRSANELGSAADAAMQRGDFDSATRLREQARQAAQRASEEASGWTGLWNSVSFW